MAFCKNCGKSLEEGSHFCTNCGTPVQSASASPALQPPSTSTAAAPAVVPVISEVPASVADSLAQSETPLPDSQRPAPQSCALPDTELPVAPQSAISPFFVIICGILVLLIGAGIAGTVYLQKQRAPKAKAEQSQTPAPSASAPVTSAPATAPAIPDSIRVLNLGNYPGATPVAIATLTGETVIAGFLTHDTPQQVIQFYKIRFPVSSEQESEGKVRISATLPENQRVRIEAQPQSPNTQVIIFLEH